jgi:hypothetical protein
VHDYVTSFVDFVVSSCGASVYAVLEGVASEDNASRKVDTLRRADRHRNHFLSSSSAHASIGEFRRLYAADRGVHQLSQL